MSKEINYPLEWEPKIEEISIKIEKPPRYIIGLKTSDNCFRSITESTNIKISSFNIL